MTLLGDGFPTCFQNRILNLLAVRKRNKHRKFSVSGGTQLGKNFVTFGNICFTITVNEENSSIVGRIFTNSVNCDTVQTIRIDNRVVAILKIEMLYLYACRGHLETIPESFVVDNTNVMGITVGNTVFDKIIYIGLTCFFTKRVPLNLLRLRIITIAERYIETVFTEICWTQRSYYGSGVRVTNTSLSDTKQTVELFVA